VRKLGLEKKVAVLSGSLLSAIPSNRSIDIVVSNPPYIPNSDIDDLAPEVREFEPRMALEGGQDGLDIYRKLIPSAANRARVAVLVEVGIRQAPAVLQMMVKEGLQDCRTVKDLGGIERVVIGNKPD
jgi:release factor glutamine methyltransferase